MKPEDIALFDMDGTLCDYETALRDSMEALESPLEPPYVEFGRNTLPDYLKARRDLILSKTSWWTSLKRLELGFDIWTLAGHLGYKRMILTQGPRKNPKSWMGKKMWINQNTDNVDVTITRDKGLIYGKVLVDDWPEHIEKWLKWRPRGLVIMPAHNYNEKYYHLQVIRYDGSNMDEVATIMKDRLGG